MKSVIIGLDGATFRVFDRYRSQLPTLNRLVEQGYSAELTSSYPATTSVAWPSMATGQNPAKFGIADFIYRDPFTLDFHLNDARRKSFDFFWEFMEEQIGLASVPIIPYHNIDGFFIQGSLAHISAERITKPNDLESKIPPDYDYEIDWRNGPRALFNGLCRRVDARRDVFQYLVRNYDLSIYFFEFDAIDRIQHHFWAYMDETHPNHEPSEFNSAILEIWEKIDKGISSILSEFDEEVNVIIVSDHGFGPCHTELNIGAILQQKGYLSHNLNTTQSVLSSIAEQVNKFLGRSVTSRITPKRLQDAVSRKIPSSEDIGETINWRETTAYSFGVMANVFLNVEGRERLGTVPPDDYECVLNDVAGTLDSFQDDRTGESPIEVIPKDEIYSGPYIDFMPDLVVETSEGYKAKHQIGSELVHHKQGVIPNSGTHEREGIFIANGPAFVNKNRAPDPHAIVDIAPTFLHLYDYPVPSNMDGRVLTEALLSSSPVRHVDMVKNERQRIRNRILSLKQLHDI